MNGPTIVPCRVITASTASAVLCLVPVGLGGDEEGGLAGAAVRQLNDQVVAETRLPADALQLGIARDGGQHVRHAGGASLVAQPGGGDLGVEAAAQRVRRQDQPVAQFGADRLGLLVEEHGGDPGAAAVPPSAWPG